MNETLLATIEAAAARPVDVDVESINASVQEICDMMGEDVRTLPLAEDNSPLMGTNRKTQHILEGLQDMEDRFQMMGETMDKACYKLGETIDSTLGSFGDQLDAPYDHHVPSTLAASGSGL